MHGELSGEGTGLLAAHTEDAVVRGQHTPVKQHYVLIIMIRSELTSAHIHQTLHFNFIIQLIYTWPTLRQSQIHYNLKTRDHVPNIEFSFLS